MKYSPSAEAEQNPQFLAVLLFALSAPLLGIAWVGSDLAVNALAAVVFSLVFAHCYAQSRVRTLSPLYLIPWGVIMYGTALHWIPRIIATFGEFSVASSVLITAVLLAISSLQFALVHFLFTRINSGWIKEWRLSLPLSWLAAEALWHQLIPWRLGDLVLGIPWLAAGAGLLGTSFLSFLLLWWSSTLMMKPGYKVRVTAAICLALVLLFGGIQENRLRTALATATQLRVLVVQGNLDPIRDFRSDRLNANLLRYRTLTATALRDFHADVIIWPESSVGFDYYLGEKTIVRGTDRDPFPGLSQPLIFGGQLRRREQLGLKPQYYNSIIALAPDGEILGSYRKQQLFPFSEVAPLGGLLPQISERPYDLLSGSQEKPLTLSLADRSVTIASVICFEDLWPGLLRQLATQSDLLLAISNDNWFLDSVAPTQHHHLASMRSIELGRHLLRVTNSGVTALVDPLGRTTQSLVSSTPGTLALTVPLIRIPTPYATLGDIPVYLMVLVTVVASLAIRRR